MAASELSVNLFDSETEFPSMLCFHEPCSLNWENWSLNGEALLGLLVFIWSCSPSIIHEVTAAGADVVRRRASGSDTTRASEAVPLFELSRNNLHESQASSQPIGSQSLPPHLASPPPPHHPPSLLHHASANQDLTHSDRASEGLL